MAKHIPIFLTFANDIKDHSHTHSIVVDKLNAHLLHSKYFKIYPSLHEKGKQTKNQIPSTTLLEKRKSMNVAKHKLWIRLRLKISFVLDIHKINTKKCVQPFLNYSNLLTFLNLSSLFLKSLWAHDY